MSRTLRLLPRADFDIDELVEYIASRDERAALRFQDRVNETMARIARWPHLGTRQYSRTGREYRLRQVLHYPKFVIIYELTTTTIEIARVVRGSRNLKALLND